MSLWSPHPPGPHALAGLGTVGSWAVALETPPLPLQPYYCRPGFEGTGKDQRASPDISPHSIVPSLQQAGSFLTTKEEEKKDESS